MTTAGPCRSSRCFRPAASSFPWCRVLPFFCSLYRQERIRLVEIATFVRDALRPREQPAGVDHDLSGRVEFDVRAVHRTRRRAFEVHTLGVIPRPMARALELVLR